MNSRYFFSTVACVTLVVLGCTVGPVRAAAVDESPDRMAGPFGYVLASSAQDGKGIDAVYATPLPKVSSVELATTAPKDFLSDTDGVIQLSHTVEETQVPLPATLPLAASALAGLRLLHRRGRTQRQR